MDDLNSGGIIKEVDFEDFTAKGVEPDARLRAKWKLLSAKGPFPVDPSVCDIWAGNTRDVQALDSAAFLDLRASLISVGQQVPVIVRILATNPSRLEVIAGACRLTAICQINEKRPPENKLRIIVHLRELDDEAAIKIVDAENRGRSGLAPIEQARFYERAIETTYHTESALADALGLHKSTINRTLAIQKLPDTVIGLITDVRQISAAQANAFLGDWAKPELRETLENVAARLTAKGPAAAAAVFKAMKQAVDTPSAIKIIAIMHDGTEVGVVRPLKDGGLIIELSARARELGVVRALEAAKVALRQLSKSAA